MREETKPTIEELVHKYRTEPFFNNYVNRIVDGLKSEKNVCLSFCWGSISR